MQKNYFVKNPHTASKLFWSGKVKPVINNSVGGLYNGTQVYLPVRHQEDLDGTSFVKQNISGPSDIAPAIPASFLHDFTKSDAQLQIQQEGSGVDPVEEAFNNPVKVSTLSPSR